MKKIEATGLVIVVVLLAYRVFVGMELGVLLRVSITLLSIFYLWFGLFLFNPIGMRQLFTNRTNPKLHPLRISLSIAGGLIYSFSFIAIMFAVSFYPGMNAILMTALGFNALFLFSSIVILKMNKEKGKYLLQFVWRSIVMVSVFLALLFLPVDKRLTTLYKEHPAFIQAYKEYIENPDDTQVQMQLKEQRSAFRQ